MISLSLRPLMPPCSLTSSKRILTPFDDDTPYVAATPDRSVCVPNVTSVAVTPRLCAAAAVASDTAAVAAAAVLTIVHLRIALRTILRITLTLPSDGGIHWRDPPFDTTISGYTASAYMPS